LITLLLKAATEKGEDLARRAFITQTLELTVDAWPADWTLTLLRPRLQSVTSVKYLADDGAEATWTDYTVDAKNEPGKLVFESLPGVALEESGAVTVRFVAGYGDTETAVPDRIKLALLMLVAHWYENRDVGDVPDGVKKMFIGERVVWF
jgi:uncharacterized phiE125 gp8 family phage protein